MKAPRLLWALALAAGGLVACSESTSPECQLDDECPAGFYCRAGIGECAFDCTKDTECPAGQVCSVRGQCQEGCHPTNGGVEACDGIDNDCDDQTDEVEPRACHQENQFGRCDGEESCQGGTWVCDAGNPAEETCDGEDNDCNGQTDEGLEGSCPLQEGVCTGATRTCQGNQGWTECNYGPYHEPEPENSCDGRDNDCDGETDEDIGPTDTCETGPLASDGIDNNCNGLVDEPGGCMLEIPFYPGTYIDTYEAIVFENQDCTGHRYGDRNHDYPLDWPEGPEASDVTLYACSLPGLRPSRGATWYQARRACWAQGKRLCDKAEWAMACTDTSHWDFPYGTSYNPDICNTFSAGQDDTVANGSMPDCVSQIGVYDMSGNLFEWANDECRNDPSRRTIQGGSYWCSYCDESMNCDPCDMDNPEHAEYIDYLHQCHSPAYAWYCEEPLTLAWNFGFRCCFDRE